MPARRVPTRGALLELCVAPASGGDYSAAEKRLSAALQAGMAHCWWRRTSGATHQLQMLPLQLPPKVEVVPVPLCFFVLMACFRPAGLLPCRMSCGRMSCVHSAVINFDPRSSEQNGRAGRRGNKAVAAAQDLHGQKARQPQAWSLVTSSRRPCATVAASAPMRRVPGLSARLVTARSTAASASPAGLSCSRSRSMSCCTCECRARGAGRDAGGRARPCNHGRGSGLSLPSGLGPLHGALPFGHHWTFPSVLR